MPNEDFIMQLGMMEQRAQQIEQQLQLIDENLTDLQQLKIGLEELKDSKGKEVFASVGRGIFVKAKIEDNELLADVGEKNFVKKDVPGAQKMLDEQINKISTFKEQLLNELQRMNLEFQQILENAEVEKEE